MPLLPNYLAVPTTLFGILVMLFSIWMIVDCIRADNPPWWIFLIFITAPSGLGAAVYFMVHKLPQYELGRRWHAIFAGRRHIDELKVKIRDMDRPYHWAELGHEYRAQRRWKEAAEAYRQALERDPEAEDARYGLGMVLLAMGDHGGALDQIQPLVAANPRYDYGGGAIAIARAWRGLGRRDEALAAYETVLANYGYSEIRYEYADLLHETGRRDEARRLMQRIVEDAAAARGFHSRKEKRWGRRARIFLKTHPG